MEHRCENTTNNNNKSKLIIMAKEIFIIRRKEITSAMDALASWFRFEFSKKKKHKTINRDQEIMVKGMVCILSTNQVTVYNNND